MNVADELQKLNELKKSGALSEAEFAAAKAHLLSTAAGGTQAPVSGPTPVPISAPASSPSRGSAGMSVGRGALIAVLILVVAGVVLSMSGSTGSSPVASVLSGSKPAPTAAEIAEQLREQKHAEREALKDRVRSSPGGYLEVVGIHTVDDGIINTYRRLDTLTVRNKSPFSLTITNASITWLQGDSEVGTVPVSLTGSVSPGHELMFSESGGSLSNNKLEVSADKYRMNFTAVDLVDPSPEW